MTAEVLPARPSSDNGLRIAMVWRPETAFLPSNLAEFSSFKYSRSMERKKSKNLSHVLFFYKPGLKSY